MTGETMTGRDTSEACTRYYLSTIVAQIIEMSMPGLSGVGHLTQGGPCRRLGAARSKLERRAWVGASGGNRDPTTIGRNELRPYKS